ncbi:hypothetical protein [Micromonospora sp. NPDC005087]
MTVEWGRLTPTLRAGEWTCLTHGRTRPAAGGVFPRLSTLQRAGPPGAS